MSELIVGRSAIVTGGGSGLGAEIARRLAARGARVVIADLDEAAAGEVARQIGPSAAAVAADVRRDADVARLVDAACATAPLGVLVLSAAIERRAPLLECTDADWQDVIDTNLKGPFLCMRRAIPRLVDAGGGAIIALGSTLGLIASPGYPAYVASKGALTNLVKLAATEHAHQGVRINLLAPSACDTGLFMRTSAQAPDPEQLRARVARSTPMRRLGSATDVCEAVLFLAGEGGSYITGAVLPVDGGLAARRAWTA